MWLLFHRKAGTKVVAGAETFVEHCPTCERRTKFEQIEMTEQYGVWFVDIVGDKQHAYRCRVCNDVFDLRDDGQLPATKARELPASSHVDRVEALAAEQRQRDAANAAKATRIEDELAELKKRMGR